MWAPADIAAVAIATNGDKKTGAAQSQLHR